MPKRRKKMKNMHNFLVRKINPITGKITIVKEPHVVLVPPEPVTLSLTKEGILQSKKLRGRGNSNTCSAQPSARMGLMRCTTASVLAN